MKRFLGFLTVACACLALHSAPYVIMNHGVPCNIYEKGSDVAFGLKLTDKNGTTGVMKVKVTDYTGEVVMEEDLSLNAVTSAVYPLEFGSGLEVGYYEVKTTITNGGETIFEQINSFAVTNFVDRTAAEVRDGGYRFGMKLWLIGDIWWDRNLTWDPDKIMAMCCRLGLQWTRAQLGQVDYMNTVDLINNHPVNVVLKVESYPSSMIDRSRYPNISDFENVSGGTKALLPIKEQYQPYLRELVAQIPPEQTVFEIWNEPWQWKTMPAEDFALLASWAAEAIRQERPDAIIGPNIYGLVNEYDRRVINAGGMDDMDMVASHPYCTRTPEYRGFRQQYRNYADFVRNKLGKNIDFYSTEFGWTTAPLADTGVSEMQQARNSVREAFELYAGDFKTIIPHTMATREYNPAEREDYFGYFRLNSEPKPALVALSVAAQMIDGSEYVGEQYLGHGIGAMRFRKDGVETLALWTEDVDKTVSVNVGSLDVEVYDMMGRNLPIQAAGGNLTLEVSGDPVYVVGVAALPASELIGPDDNLIVGLWRERPVMWTLPGSLSLPVAATPEAYGAELIDLKDTSISRSSLKSYWSWTPNEMAILFDVKDNTIVTTAPDGSGFGDRIDFFLNLRPDRQADLTDLYDYRFIITPAPVGGAAKMQIINVGFNQNIEVNQGVQPTNGVTWSYEAVEGGYRVELRFPVSSLGVERIEPGHLISNRIILYNRDRTDINEWSSWNTRIYTQTDKAVFNELYLLQLTD